MKTRLKLLIILLTLSLCSFVQSNVADSWMKADKAEAITSYEKAIAWFAKTNSYKVNISYASYKDHATMDAHERENGFYKRSGNNFQSKALGILTIQNSKMKVIIDTAGRLIVVTNRTEIAEAPVNTEAMTKIFSAAKAISKKKTIDGLLYRLEFNSNGIYDAYEFEIDNKGLIKKLGFHYSKEMQKNENEVKTKPRMEISFSAYETNKNGSAVSEFSIEKYFRLEGKKIILQPRYKTYELKDYRFDQK